MECWFLLRGLVFACGVLGAASDWGPPTCWDEPECWALNDGEGGHQRKGGSVRSNVPGSIITDTYWGFPAFYLRDHLVGREKWDLRGVALRVFERFALLPRRRANSPYLVFFKPTFCGWEYRCPPLVDALIRNRTDVVWIGHDLTGMILAYPDHRLPGVTIPGELASTIYHAWRYRGSRSWPHKHLLTFQGKCPSKHHAHEWYLNYSVRGELNRLFNLVNKQNYGNEPRPGLPDGVEFNCIQKQRGRFSSDEIVAKYDDLLDTQFALVPRGDERWSFRFLEAVGAGAIPVVVADGLTLPFENLIDWEQIVVRIPERAVVEMDTFSDFLALLPTDHESVARRHDLLVKVNDEFLKDGDMIKTTFRTSLYKYIDTNQRADHVFIDYDTYDPPPQAVSRGAIPPQPRPPPAADDAAAVAAKSTAVAAAQTVLPELDPWLWLIESVVVWYALFVCLALLLVLLHLRRRRRVRSQHQSSAQGARSVPAAGSNPA
ncbi:hypothetical protein CTAYLR_003399 [Chrysophaeum taylorii]|uniref:Exostosin GT47 domain-containing protein n=1 Tax=Chrysophaeum taylorii TaxID=2483200 RepID=A0AAD7XHP2_9STRA|nr:hypothetical protein CTAYLR_003399 [Chrysophaeum taylorii]